MAGIAVNNTMVAFRIWAVEMLKVAEQDQQGEQPAARRSAAGQAAQAGHGHAGQGQDQRRPPVFPPVPPAHPLTQARRLKPWRW